MHTPHMPRRNGPVAACLGRWTMALMGWRIEGRIPDLDKFVLIGAPHSSNWDFIVGMAAMFALDLKLTILGKHTLFIGPLAPLMRFCGLVPIDRRSSSGVVGACVQTLAASDRIAIALAPEGTRTPGAKWKTGFWHIARQADVPVVPVALDFGTKCIRIGPTLVTTQDLAADMQQLSAFYSGIRGKKRTISDTLSY